MHKIHDVIRRRSDRKLVAAFAVVFLIFSAAVGAAAGYRPHTEYLRTTAVAEPPPAPTPPVAQPAAAPTAEDLVRNELLEEHRCLSEALYYEARGEGTTGQKAIAEVIFTRLRSGNYGRSICDVVYEGAHHPHCQFSFTCDGELKRSKTPAAWLRSMNLAARIMLGEERLTGVTDGATNFHSVSVDPLWSDTMDRTVQIGNHIFYKDPPRSRAL